ncbi:hypothetical protein BJX70DRAFT_402885 [Aspergillus crustosus]
MSFISAVSSYSSLSGISGPVPEEVIPNSACTASIGYGESKYIAERTLEYASTRYPTSTFGMYRIGQVAGTAKNPRGWNRHEWLPNLIISSRYLGALPETLGRAGGQFDTEDWVPLDALAGIVTELSGGLKTTSMSSTAGVRVFNVTNPRSIAWKDLILIVVEELASSRPGDIDLVPFATWLQKLQDSIVSDEGKLDLDQNPAGKLAEFYQQLLTTDTSSVGIFSSKRTKELSRTLSELQPVQAEWLRGWIGEWLH